MRFLHTADWQLGRPFAGTEEPEKRALLQQERIACLARIADAARAHGAAFVVVCGDVFDSPHATKSTVSAACSAIGQMPVPVYVIPGNHDHGGPGSLWEQPFFQREAVKLAPNLHVLLEPDPLELPDAVLFPCPLLRRSEPEDTTQWLRSATAWDRFGEKPRIVLAHGSTQDFGSGAEDDELGDGAGNRIDLSRLPAGAYDYIALGDWHGTKQVAPNAWYSGTPELDRFPKGGDHDPGHVLLVEVTRGAAARVTPVRTARFGWHSLAFSFADDAGVAQFEAQLGTLIGSRAGQDLLRLELSGSLSLTAMTQLEQLLDSLSARLIRLKVDNRTILAPSRDEELALTQRASDPLISRVAAALVARAAGEGEDAAIARVALRELHAALADATQGTFPSLAR